MPKLDPALQREVDVFERGRSRWAPWVREEVQPKHFSVLYIRNWIVVIVCAPQARTTASARARSPLAYLVPTSVSPCWARVE